LAGRSKSTSYALLPRRQANIEFEKFVTGSLTMDIKMSIDVSLRCIMQAALSDLLLPFVINGKGRLRNKIVR